MKYSIGIIGVRGVVEITNRQQHVEYKVIEGWVSEEDARQAAGNYACGTYDCFYDGSHPHRKPAVERMESKIKELKKELEELEFSLKVTKKKKWIEVK